MVEEKNIHGSEGGEAVEEVEYVPDPFIDFLAQAIAKIIVGE